ncbi:MAG: tetratricopeptide repeat protein [Bacteroidales bacterium]|nr:tetratricopeptide repeat protein [Bacteroidales bacterium]
MKRLLLPLILAFLLPLAGISGGNYHFNRQCKKAYHEILALRLDSGKAILDREREVNPDNLIPVYLENYIDFLKIIISEEEELLEKLKDNKKKRKELLLEGNKNSPYYRYCLANLELQWAFSRLKFEEYFATAFEINRAYRLLSENRKKYPDFLPNNIEMGILHTIIGLVPDKFEWFTSLFGFEGTISQGEEELKEVVFLSSGSPYAHLRTEALFFLTFISLNLNEDLQQAEHLWGIYQADSMKSLVEGNLLLTYAQARLAMETGRNDEAIGLLTERPHGKQYYPFHYLDYLAGRTKMYRMDENAVEYLFDFTSNFNGINFIKSAYQYIAWYFLLHGNQELYHQNMKKADYNGSSIVGADKRAELALEKNITPAKCILESRLLFDGGYYDRSLKVLKRVTTDEVNGLSQHDYLEYIYRFGRIYQKTNKDDQALEWYRQAIEKGRGTPYYFAANAALMSAKIYEKKGNLAKALSYYEMVQELDFDEYEQSIKQKAKARMQRLENQ